MGGTTTTMVTTVATTTMGTTVATTTMGTTTTIMGTTTTTVATTITTTTTVEDVVAPRRPSGEMAAGRETVSHLTMEVDAGVTPPDGTRVVPTIIPRSSIPATPGPTRHVIIIMEIIMC